MVTSDLTDKQDRSFVAHVSDLFAVAREKNTARFTDFLDLHKLALARRVAAAEGYANHCFFGGFPDAERVMLGIFPLYETVSEDAFPLLPITAAFRAADDVGHRDLLGSLTALEIRREAVGDILVEQGRAVFFVTKAVAPVILSELRKAGRCGVRLSEGAKEPLPMPHCYEDLRLVVASTRLDCVIAAVTGASREKSAQTIRAKLVFLDGAVETELSRPICEGNVVSVRGFGKFLFAEVGGMTKKGRLQILCRKYS